MLVLCAVKYYLGKKRNEAIALEWGNTFTDLFTQNFSSVRRKSRVEMVRDSACEYKMFATGRKNVRAMICSLHLARRQDLVSQVLGLVTPAIFDMDRPDTLVVEVALDEDKVDPFVFSMIPAKDRSTLMETREDLKQLAKVYPADNVLPKYVVATDTMELTSKRGLLTDEVQAVLSQCAKYFVNIHISDMLQYVSNQPRTMQLTFLLPPLGEMDKIQPLMNMVLLISDRIASTNLSAKAQELNIKARQQFAEKQKEDTDSQKAPKKEKSLAKQKKEARAAKKERTRKELENKQRLRRR